MPANLSEEVRALSLSRTVRARLGESAARGRVMAAFERACILVPARGDPFSLVLPEIGDGPLNIVVPGTPGRFGRLQPGTPWARVGRGLRVGHTHVDLVAARVWEPSPAWDRLRVRRPEIEARLGELLVLAGRGAADGSLLAALARGSGDRFDASVWRTAVQAGAALRAAWPGPGKKAVPAAAQLAGLGRGLTPAGDDFLAGLMLWAWLAHPDPQAYCQALCRAAAPRTTALSAAFLRVAARGECSAAWHTLFDQLAAPGGHSLQAEVVKGVLSYGQTSGADTLAGFLWLTARQEHAGWART